MFVSVVTTAYLKTQFIYFIVQVSVSLFMTLDIQYLARTVNMLVLRKNLASQCEIYATQINIIVSTVHFSSLLLHSLTKQTLDQCPLALRINYRVYKVLISQN